MTNITCFINKFTPADSITDATPVLQSRRFAMPLSATIRREGSRMTDNATLKFFSGVSIDNNDYIGYIQDEVSPDGLVGLWNFTSSCRDESGYEHNPANDYTSSFSSNITFKSNNLEARISERLCAYFNNVSVTFPNKLNDTANSTMDFKYNFSINLSIILTTMNTWGTSSTQYDRVLFDKYNESTNRGVKIFIRHLTNNNWKFGIHLGNGSQTELLSGEYTTADLQDKLLTLALVREAGIVKLYFDNTTIITSTTYTSDLTDNTDLIIGQTVSNFKAYFCQLRIYIRALSSDEITRLYQCALPITTLKFYGKVWKIDSGNTTDTVYCNGLSEIILNTKINDGV